MCVTLPAWIAVPLIQAGQIDLVEAAPFSLLCLIGLYVVGRFFLSIQDRQVHSRGENACTSTFSKPVVVSTKGNLSSINHILAACQENGP